MTSHRIYLRGPGTRGVRVSAGLLKDFMVFLVHGAQEAVRLRVDGRSRAPGKTAGWIERAADFDVVGFEAGSTQVVLEARSLAESAPEVFGQNNLFQFVDARRTGIDLLAESLEDAIEGREDSELFDDGLIARFEDLESVMSRGIESISFQGAHPFRVVEQALASLGKLKRAIPPEQRVVVAGKLDELKHSERMFMLNLEDGTNVRGVVSSPDVDLGELGKLWGAQVRIEGLAKFRPSGRVLRVETDRIVGTSGDISIWSHAPKPVFAALDERTLRVPQGPKSGVSAIFGQWPGDESEEEFQEALRKIS